MHLSLPLPLPVKTWSSVGREVQAVMVAMVGPPSGRWLLSEVVQVVQGRQWLSAYAGQQSIKCETLQQLTGNVECLFTWFAVIGFTVNNWVPTATNMICKLWSDWSHFSQSRTNIITPGELNGIHTWMFFLNPRIFSQVCTKQAYLAHHRAPPGWIIWHQ